MFSLFKLGFKPNHVKVSKTTTEIELIDIVNKLNSDETVHGIIVQLPLDTEEVINTTKVINTVSPQKDVDW